MVDLKIIDAAQAYGRVLGQGTEAKGLEGRGGDSFKAALTDSIKDAIGTTAKSEVTSMQAITKEADLIDVVTSVANAELVVETVVAVRDRVIQAYNDIIRMPI